MEEARQQLERARYTTVVSGGRSLRQSGAFSFNLHLVSLVEQVGAITLYLLERHLSLEHSWLEHTQACHSLVPQSQRQAPQQRQRREHL
jgi:hypothetical protein